MGDVLEQQLPDIIDHAVGALREKKVRRVSNDREANAIIEGLHCRKQSLSEIDSFLSEIDARRAAPAAARRRRSNLWDLVSPKGARDLQARGLG
jgi:hypothetical protein